MTAKLSAEELERLEALAKAATPGPWAYESVNEKGNDWCVGVIVDANDQPVSGRVVGDEDGAVDVFVCSGDGLHNAAYIAAVNPAVLLRLLAEVSRLKAVEQRAYGIEQALLSEQRRATQAGVKLSDANDALAAATAQVREAEARWSTLKPFVNSSGRADNVLHQIRAEMARLEQERTA